MTAAAASDASEALAFATAGAPDAGVAYGGAASSLAGAPAASAAAAAAAAREARAARRVAGAALGPTSLMQSTAPPAAPAAPARGVKRAAEAPPSAPPAAPRARPVAVPPVATGGGAWRPPARVDEPLEQEDDEKSMAPLASVRGGFRTASSALGGGRPGARAGSGASDGRQWGDGGDNRDVFGPGSLHGGGGARGGVRRGGFQPPRLAGAEDSAAAPGGARRRPRMQKAEAAATRAVLGNSRGGRGSGGGCGGGGGGGGGGNQQQGGGGGDEEGPMERVLAALGLPPESPLPESLQQMDVNILDRTLSEVMSKDPGVRFDSVSGLEHVKRSINESLVWPMLHPELFTGLRTPQRGLLLFGPPGTGKTLIGKAIAGEAGATFFAIQASSLTSKWIGEGEKMVRALFACAACMQPAVVFIDEIDSVLSARGDGEHEASRRMKTEILTAVDGLGTTGDERILTIGATNKPEDLDEAARRRLPQRLMVGLPNAEARKDLIERALATIRHGGVAISPDELAALVSETDGYSGSDLKSLLKDASLEPIREMQRAAMKSGAAIDASAIRALFAVDVRKTLRRVRPSVEQKELDRYAAWDKQHGTLRLSELDDD